MGNGAVIPLAINKSMRKKWLGFVILGDPAQCWAAVTFFKWRKSKDEMSNTKSGSLCIFGAIMLSDLKQGKKGLITDRKDFICG